MSDIAIKIVKLGKAYRLYSKQSDRILDSLGINRLLFLKKNYYQEFWALRDIDIIIERGERVGLIGRNGAGKSTLLKIIAKNIAPTTGQVFVNGRVDALMELGTGFHPEFTGRENIRASLGLYGFSHKEIKRLEEEIIDFAEIDDFIDYPVKTYSQGMYARLAFSVATMLKPDILIIDEILGAGDAYFAGKCIERMKRLTEESGATVLFVSHDVSSVQKLCNRAILLEKGRILQDGDTLEVTKRYMAMIREMENTRLKIKSLGLMRKDGELINTEYGKNVLLFHFIEENWERIRGSYPIVEIELTVDDQFRETIEVGAPMDNDTNRQGYLITSPNYTEWSLPQKIKGYLTRMVTDFGGIYRHAPFVFRFPEYISDFERVTIRIKYLDTCKGRIFLEVYDGNSYLRIGELPFEMSGELREVRFGIQEVLKRIKYRNQTGDYMAKNSNEASRENVVAIKGDIYGEIGDLIESVRILDSDSVERYVFITRERMVVRIYYNSKDRIYRPVFVVAIYGTDGSVINQAISSKDGFDIEYIDGRGYVDIIYDPLIIGEGDYVISVGIFKSVDLLSRGENPSYSVHDRRYFIKVRQPHNLKVPLGIVNQDIKWEHKSEI